MSQTPTPRKKRRRAEAGGRNEGGIGAPTRLVAGVGAVESPRGADVHWVRLAPDGTVDRLRIRSASFPNWPLVPLAVPGNLVPDFPMINKSFELCYACCDR